MIYIKVLIKNLRLFWLSEGAKLSHFNWKLVLGTCKTKNFEIHIFNLRVTHSPSIPTTPCWPSPPQPRQGSSAFPACPWPPVQASQLRGGQWPLGNWLWSQWQAGQTSGESHASSGQQAPRSGCPRLWLSARFGGKRVCLWSCPCRRLSQTLLPWWPLLSSKSNVQNELLEIVGSHQPTSKLQILHLRSLRKLGSPIFLLTIFSNSDLYFLKIFLNTL